MTLPPFCIRHLRDTLSPSSLEHALQVLAEATSATALLFDSAGEPVVGPVAGSALIGQLLASDRGREVVLSAHRAALEAGHSAADDHAHPTNVLAAAGLDHFAIPLDRDGRRAGTMTFGDRPRQPITADAVEQIASAVGLAPARLAEAASRLNPWTNAEALAARNMAALVAELFTDLCIQEQDLRRRIEELTAVYNIAGLLAGGQDLQGILNKTAHLVCDVMKVKACSIRMLDEATGNLQIRAVWNLSEEYLNKGPVTVTENPIDAAAVRGEVVRVADAPTDPRTRYPEQARAEGIVSGLITGMIYRGKAVGVLRVYTGQPHVFSPFEESLLRAVAAQAAAAIVNARLLADALEAERYTRQIAYAGEVQRRMIPARPPTLSHVEIGAVYRPTFNVGGDFYDFIPLPKGNLGLAIADVSGKGVPASLQMASLRSALRVYARFTYDVNRIMAEVNRHLCRDTTLGEFATAFYGVLTPDGRRLTCCNAGHDPPLLLRDGQVGPLERGGMVLGVDPDAAYDTHLVHLRRGDVLLLYTDGAVEALNFHDEQFGRRRLAESFRRHAEQPAQRVAKNILWDIRRFRGLADRTDDLTMVVLKIQ